MSAPAAPRVGQPQDALVKESSIEALVRELYAQGEQSYDKQNYPEAILRFEAAIAANRRLGDLTVLHALKTNLAKAHLRLYERSGVTAHRDEAIKLFRGVIASDEQSQSHSCQASDSAHTELEVLGVAARVPLPEAALVGNVTDPSSPPFETPNPEVPTAEKAPRPQANRAAKLPPAPKSSVQRLVKLNPCIAYHRRTAERLAATGVLVLLAGIGSAVTGHAVAAYRRKPILDAYDSLIENPNLYDPNKAAQWQAWSNETWRIRTSTLSLGLGLSAASVGLLTAAIVHRVKRGRALRGGFRVGCRKYPARPRQGPKSGGSTP